jgi:hypothetical protein
MVDTAVPRATARRLSRTVAIAAGLRPGRGDTLAITRVRFAARGHTTTAASLPSAAVRWALLAAAVLAFFFTLAPARRESALI